MAKEEILDEISLEVRSFDMSRGNYEHRRKKITRSMDEILSSKQSENCHEDGLLYNHFAGKQKIPTIYVETIKRDWLRESGSKIPATIEGHVFIDALIGKKFVPVDPRYGRTEIVDNCFIMNPKGKRIEYEVLGIGTDYSRIHLKNGSELEIDTVSIQTIKDIRKAIQKVFMKS